jgi:hypothetical protein
MYPTTRDRSRLGMFAAATRELGQALARIARNPGFTCAAVLSLALAIGANVTVFTVIDRVLVNPLPYPESGRLITLDFAMPSRNISGFNSITSRMYFQFGARADAVRGDGVSNRGPHHHWRRHARACARRQDDTLARPGDSRGPGDWPLVLECGRRARRRSCRRALARPVGAPIRRESGDSRPGSDRQRRSDDGGRRHAGIVRVPRP